LDLQVYLIKDNTRHLKHTLCVRTTQNHQHG
jgi:hypothetical protein